MTTYIFSNNIIEGGWITKSFTDVNFGINTISSFPPDVILIDLNNINMENSNLRTIRKIFNGPLLVIGKGNKAAKALEMGADDYVSNIELAQKAVLKAIDKYKIRNIARSLDYKIQKALDKCE